MNLSSFNFANDPLSASVKFYNIEGNTNVDDAEVVVLSYDPTLENYAQNNSKLINQIWDQHLILVDEIIYKTTIKADNYYLTKYVSYNTDFVQGWDYLFTKSHITNLDQKEHMIDRLKNFIQQELKQKRNDWSFQDRKNMINAIKLEIENIFDKIKAKKIKHFLRDLESISLADMVEIYANKLIADLQQELYKLTATHYYSTFPQRQELIRLSINDQLASGRKVIICLNGNHIIHNPLLSPMIESEVTALVEFLKTKKFVILHPKKSHLPLSNNNERWGKKFKALSEENKPKPTLFSPLPLRYNSINIRHQKRDENSSKVLDSGFEILVQKFEKNNQLKDAGFQTEESHLDSL